jgi:hypothetical protein
MGVMGVVTQVVQEWSRPLFPDSGGINPVYSALVFGALLYYLFWQGKHNFFEKILAIFVTIMGVFFIATIIVKIDNEIKMINDSFLDTFSNNFFTIFIDSMIKEQVTDFLDYTLILIQ